MSLPKVPQNLLDELKMVKALYHMGATKITVGSTSVEFQAPFDPKPRVEGTEVRIVTPDGEEVIPFPSVGSSPVSRARADLSSLIEETVG